MLILGAGTTIQGFCKVEPVCGIAGAIGFDNAPSRVAVMLPFIEHRGPDCDGHWQSRDGRAGFGHKRLSILDIDAGPQPMLSPDGNHVLTYNGEIYNYLELRPNLEARGWRFTTGTDTEVLLAGLVFEGIGFLEKTIGMFAFALWNEEEQRLIVARDRVGIKPLYYCEAAGGLLFASELKALVAARGRGVEINTEALDQYLALRFVPGPQTMVAGIEKFPPGCWGEYRKQKLSLHRYWRPDFSSGLETDCAQVQNKKVRELLSDAVRLRMRSDVPYGAFLSGGVDSSLITALMAKHSSKPIKTFSIGFQSEADELPEAAAMAKAIGADHTEFHLIPDDLDRLPEVAWYMDEPFPDPIVLAMFRLAEEAHKSVKVILTGEGADELFGGYVHHANLATLARYSCLAPRPLLSLGGNVAGQLPMSIIDRLFSYPASPGPEGRARLANLVREAKSPDTAYELYTSLFLPQEREALLTRRSGAVDVPHPAFSGSAPDSVLDSIWNFEYTAWLPDNILFKQDKTLMAASIEGRVPFCDHRLVEYAQRLSVGARISRGRNKILLRDVARQLVPQVPAHSAGKRAFMVPLSGPYGERLRMIAGDVLTGRSARESGLFKATAIDAMLKAFIEPTFILGRQLSAVLMFELWRQAVEKPIPMSLHSSKAHGLAKANNKGTRYA